MACLEMLELAAISGATETFLTAFPAQHPLTGDPCELMCAGCARSA